MARYIIDRKCWYKFIFTYLYKWCLCRCIDESMAEDIWDINHKASINYIPVFLIVAVVPNIYLFLIIRIEQWKEINMVHY